MNAENESRASQATPLQEGPEMAPAGIPRKWLEPHPVLPLPSAADYREAARSERGRAWLEKFLRNRAELIAMETADPLEYGYEPETFRAARALLGRGWGAAQPEASPYLPERERPIENRESKIENPFDELLLMGANRDGKSTFAAKFCVGRLVEKPGAVGAFFHSSVRSSIDQQQVLVRSFVPPAWRGTAKLNKRSDNYFNYTRANGFANSKFILPNGSIGLFFNYMQQVSVMEGYEFDVVWFDELVPLPFLEALAFRLSRTRRTQIITTFTPVLGYTPVVASYVGGAEILASRPAPLLAQNRVHVRGCPPGHMPYVMRGRRANSAVLFFHLGMNPYGAHEQVRAKLKDAPEEQVKIRAYGWADKQIAGAFARFSRRAHVISRELFCSRFTVYGLRFGAAAPVGEREKQTGAEAQNRKPETVNSEPNLGTRFCVIDPGGAKNWFIKWYLATPSGHTIVYREWPDWEGHGEWALPPNESAEGGRRIDWRPGPAQRDGAGRGIVAYKQLILKLEGAVYNEETGVWDYSRAEKISRRLMDSRMGGAQVPSEDEGTSLIELLYDENRDSRGRLTGPRMDFEPAPGSGIDETLQMLAERFDYDESAPVSILNCPKWYVVEDCRQSILAYEEYTGRGTQHDALKDIVDPDRYFVKAGCGFGEAGAGEIRGGGHW